MIERIETKPGDIYVLTCPGKIDVEDYNKLKSDLLSFLGSDAKVICLSGGLQLSVFSPAKAEAA